MCRIQPTRCASMLSVASWLVTATTMLTLRRFMRSCASSKLSRFSVFLAVALQPTNGCPFKEKWRRRVPFFANNGCDSLLSHLFSVLPISVVFNYQSASSRNSLRETRASLTSLTKDSTMSSDASAFLRQRRAARKKNNF